MVAVSVILSTYNRADTLVRSIDSVLIQTFKDFELIIVDDGSTDATPGLLQNYAQKDNRVKVITQSNQGLPAARNTAIAASSGKYIAFIDSDDAYAVNHLSFYISFIENNPQYSACVFSISDRIENYYLGVFFSARDKHSMCHGNPFTCAKPLGNLGAPSFITRDSFIESGGYRKETTIIEDLDFTLRYSEKHKWAKIEGVGGYFYTHPENNSELSLTNMDRLSFIKRHLSCYVSAWCRLNSIIDPVTESKSLEEITSMAKSMPLKDKVIVYKAIKFFLNMLCAVHGMSRRKAKNHLLGMLSDSIVIRKAIDIRFKISYKQTK